LGAIGPKSVRQVVEPLPELLHLDHLFADGGGHARPVLKITGRREVVGMRVRVEDPLQGEALARDVCQQLVGRMSRRGARLRIEVQDRIDDAQCLVCGSATMY
jgi:hypothetical protein